jgi:hypothetical protein
MPRGRHTATRFPPVIFVVLCLLVTLCMERTQAAPVASVRHTRAQGSFVLVPPPATATPLPDPPERPSPATTLPADPFAYRGLTAIGDSVMVDATPNLRARFPGLTVDAVAGRQVAVGIAAMQALAYSGRLGDVVVVALGTNGPFSGSQLDRIVALAGGRRVVMLTNYCPYCSWVTANNDLIRAGCRQVRDCTVAEWEGLAAANPRWFYADGVHMPIGGVGGQAYADLVARMLERTPAPRLHEPS